MSRWHWQAIHGAGLVYVEMMGLALYLGASQEGGLFEQLSQNSLV